MSEQKKDRVHKVIAQAGIMSRRKAEEAILLGRVSVNGVVLTELGRVIDPAVDVLEIDGKRVELRTRKQTFLFYKPRGVITSKSDPQGRPTVMDYFKDDPSLNPVGRLDFESEGLLLLTHDGELALQLTHPRYGVKKVYEVDISGDFPADLTERLLSGVELEDGAGKFDAISDLPVSSAKPSLFGGATGPERGFLVTVSEGRNRFIRRMFEHFGLKVTRLKRIQLGPYALGDLKPGEKREVQ